MIARKQDISLRSKPQLRIEELEKEIKNLSIGLGGIAIHPSSPTSSLIKLARARAELKGIVATEKHYKEEIINKIPKIVDGINSHYYDEDLTEFNYISERYSYWKTQQDENGFTYGFENAKKKALVDYIIKRLFGEDVSQTPRDNCDGCYVDDNGVLTFIFPGHKERLKKGEK